MPEPDYQTKQLLEGDSAMNEPGGDLSAAVVPPLPASVGVAQGDPTGSIEPDQLDQLDQAGTTESYMAPPSAKGAKVSKVNDDGSTTWSNGVTYYPGRGIQWKMGNTVFTKTTAEGKTISHQAPRNQLVDFTGPSGPYKAMVDPNTGNVLKKYDDPGSRPGAAAEQLRIRLLNSAKSQPGMVAYVNIKNNHDSLAQNAAIPEGQRTPADDAAAIQAFGAVEHPGTGVTDADKKQAEALVGKITKLRISMNNWLHNNARVLDAATVRDMEAVAKRALDGRQKTYNDELAPLLKEAQRVGLKPADVNGALGANIMPAELEAENRPTPTPAPAAAPQPTMQQSATAAANRILADPKSPPALKQKAQDALNRIQGQ